MDDVTTCPRCRGGIFVTELAQWSVQASAEHLRAQGWVGFRHGDDERAAVHLGCLTWPEKEALLGAARAPAPRVHPVARRTSLRFSRDETPVAPAHAA